MKTALFFAAFAIVFAGFPSTAQTQTPAEAATAPPSGPPADFLATQVPAWRRVLGTAIFSDFRKAEIRTVAKVLADQGLCNIVVDIPARRQVPLVTRKLHRVPLRTALYLISQDTGLKVDWIYAGKIPQAIRLY